MSFQVVGVQLYQTRYEEVSLAIHSQCRGGKRSVSRTSRLDNLMYTAVYDPNAAVNHGLCQHDMRVSENLLCRCIHALTLSWIS